LRIPDGGAGGRYDWTSGAWSVQIDFAFPASPAWGSLDHFVLVSKGSYSQGKGWLVQINNSAMQGKYQVMLESNHGLNSYHHVSSYLIVTGVLNRALFICSATGAGTWYVNGTAGSSQPCAPSSSSASDLFVGRDAGTADFAANFPIVRLQIWNRALTAAEATQSTTSDPQ
jgi:hypothetical protein